MNQVDSPNELGTSLFLVKATCSSRIASILSFYVEIKVKGVEVSIRSSEEEEELGGISK